MTEGTKKEEKQFHGLSDLFDADLTSLVKTSPEEEALNEIARFQTLSNFLDPRPKSELLPESGSSDLPEPIKKYIGELRGRGNGPCVIYDEVCRVFLPGSSYDRLPIEKKIIEYMLSIGLEYKKLW